MIFPFLKHRNKNDTAEIKCRIEFYLPIIRRVHRTLSKSNFEEGGKFLGHIYENNSEVLMQIQSYLDSGPRVDNSGVHICPDGEYQDAAFRLIETLDPQIEHLGSWHSHHCNGLDSLSGGDIAGYVRSVNSDSYRPRHFFVMLITAFYQKELDYRFYLFTKGAHEYIEMPLDEINIVDDEYPHEDLLQKAEQAASRVRTTRRSQAESMAAVAPKPETHEQDRLNEVRREDVAWFRKEFPRAVIIQDHRDQTYAWRWTSETIAIRLRYPKKVDKGCLCGQLEFSLGDQQLAIEKIVLDETRFKTIKAAIGIVHSRLAEQAKIESQK